MNETLDIDAINERQLERDLNELQLEIVELLDERFRLREDPARTQELEGTHAKLREVLHGSHRPKPPGHD